jgi:hypothetical protein
MGPAQASGCHQFHRLGDLLDISCRPDASLYFA